MKKDNAAQLEIWTSAWPKALAIWSKYTRIRPPLYCVDHVMAAERGLVDSFAMIRLDDQSVVVNLQKVKELNLDENAIEILAHEIGHHVLAPANLTDHAQTLARVLPALPSIEAQAGMVANLYTDLLINNHLKRSAGLAMDQIYKKIHSQENSSVVWKLYMRIYEILWQMKQGELDSGDLTAAQQGDAWLGARIIKVYARDWLTGAGRFAALLLPYLIEDKEQAQAATASLMDTKSAGSGQIPSGLINTDREDVIHPSEDPALTGETESINGLDTSEATSSGSSTGQCREPFEFGEILRAAGLNMSDHEIAVRYYRERAIPHLLPFPVKVTQQSIDPIPEGTQPWQVGESPDLIDWFQTLAFSPIVVPGVSTVKTCYGHEVGHAAETEPLDLDLYVDCSGSMPNPQITTSYTTLAGTVLALSALRAGARVQVTLWSGKNQFQSTPGFVNNEREILEVLTGYLGGATAFPIHVLRDTYQTKRARDSLVVIFSDDGVTTLFDHDEQGNSGWDVARIALNNSGGIGIMVLNLNWNYPLEVPHWNQAEHDCLLKAEEELGWQIYRVSDWEEMLGFARSFGKTHYN